MFFFIFSVDIFAFSVCRWVHAWGSVCFFVPIYSCVWSGDWIAGNRKKKEMILSLYLLTLFLEAPTFFICEN